MFDLITIDMTLESYIFSSIAIIIIVRSILIVHKEVVRVNKQWHKLNDKSISKIEMPDADLSTRMSDGDVEYIRKTTVMIVETITANSDVNVNRDLESQLGLLAAYLYDISTTTMTDIKSDACIHTRMSVLYGTIGKELLTRLNSDTEYTKHSEIVIKRMAEHATNIYNQQVKLRNAA